MRCGAAARVSRSASRPPSLHALGSAPARHRARTSAASSRRRMLTSVCAGPSRTSDARSTDDPGTESSRPAACTSAGSRIGRGRHPGSTRRASREDLEVDLRPSRAKTDAARGRRVVTVPGAHGAAGGSHTSTTLLCSLRVAGARGHQRADRGAAGRARSNRGACSSGSRREALGHVRPGRFVAQHPTRGELVAASAEDLGRRRPVLARARRTEAWRSALGAR